LPPEVPHALNPPNGVIIHYSLASIPSGDITIDVKDSAGRAVRHLSSAPIAPVPEAARPPHPNFWVAVPAPLPAAIGTNRTNWDLRYDAPPVFTHSFAINANPGLTPASPEGGLVAPGTYTITLTVNGKSYTQTAAVMNDPRSPATAADLRAQHVLVKKLHDAIKTAWDGYQQVAAMRTALNGVLPSDSASDVTKAIRAVRAKLDSVGGTAGGGRGFGGRGGGPAPPPTFVAMHGRLVSQLGTQENGDHAPTEAMLAGYAQSCRDLATTVARWQAINAKELPALNSVLTKNGLKAQTAGAGVPAPKC